MHALMVLDPAAKRQKSFALYPRECVEKRIGQVFELNSGKLHAASKHHFSRDKMFVLGVTKASAGHAFAQVFDVKTMHQQILLAKAASATAGFHKSADGLKFGPKVFSEQINPVTGEHELLPGFVRTENQRCIYRYYIGITAEYAEKFVGEVK